jgi:hypothetical protein
MGQGRGIILKITFPFGLLNSIAHWKKSSEKIYGNFLVAFYLNKIKILKIDTSVDF